MLSLAALQGLNKNPKDYPDSKSQPHLLVALRMLAENKPVNIGDHIPYVICLQGADGTPATQRAHHPDEVFKSKGELTIDIEWYLSQQILPPISRLCEPIEGTSVAQISLQLGLDASKFAVRSTNDDELQMDWGFVPRSMMEDSERFRDAVKLKVACKSCSMITDFPGVYSTQKSSGLACSACGSMYYGMMGPAPCYGYLSNSTTLLVRQCVKKYYDCWLRCDDLTCGRRTTQQSVNGYGCVGDCHGRMKQEYDDSALHTQLKYLESLFDVDKAVKKIAERSEMPVSPAMLESLPKDHIEIFRLLNKHMSFAIENNAFNWIRPSLWSTLFGKAGGGSAILADGSQRGSTASTK